SAGGQCDSIGELATSRGTSVSFPYRLTLHRSGVCLLFRKCKSARSGGGERCGRLGKLLDCFHSPRWSADCPGISSKAALAFCHYHASAPRLPPPLDLTVVLWT